ncbi:MAG: hypothetical protein IT426_13060 [Pirellulales bacterium]|nr:hypothetical protein [Pirellulales bacterium]
MQPHQEKANREIKLPQSILGRIGLAFFCLLFMPFSGVFLYAMFFSQNKPATILGWLGYIYFEILLSSLFVVSVTGLVWAIARPKWVESILRNYAVKLIL